MTEAEWLACNEAIRLYGAVHEQISTRKHRLFLAVCFRSVWDSLADDVQRVIQVNEWFAEGQATARDMERACLECKNVRTELPMRIIESLMEYRPSFAPLDVIAREQSIKAEPNLSVSHAGCAFGHAQLFREVVGNPFRPITIDPTWLTSNTRSLAQAAYDERALPSGRLDNARLAILGDALEDAGCTDRAILDHLRGPGPHARGCWAVDLLLDKG
jgi:hypothetical protein